MYIDRVFDPWNQNLPVRRNKTIREVQQELENLLARSHRLNETIEWDNGKFKIVLDVPGYSKEQVSLSYENEVLKITLSNENDGYTQSFSLKNIDPDTFKAKCEHGRLTITGAKPSAKPNAITIVVE